MTRPAVHTSEIKSYLRCKLGWYWSAPRPRGLNLEPKVSKAALNLGRLVHEALQIGYDTGEQFADAYETLAGDNLKALADAGPVFDSEVAEIKEQTALGVAMLEGYQSWSEGADQNLRFLAMETRWENARLGRIRYGGIFDAVVEREDGLWVFDFKTTKYTSTEWTIQDIQATGYVHAARQLYGKDVRGLIFRFLLKKAPLTYKDLILKNGTVTERKTLPSQTNYEEYTKAIAVAVLLEMIKNDFTLQGELELSESPPKETVAALLDDGLHERKWYPDFKTNYVAARRLYNDTIQSVKGTNKFFWDVPEHRTAEQVALCLRNLLVPAAKEMVSRKRGRWVGPTGLGMAFSACPRCQFAAPCKLAMAGADYKSYLIENYRQRDRSK